MIYEMDGNQKLRDDLLASLKMKVNAVIRMAGVQYQCEEDEDG